MPEKLSKRLSDLFAYLLARLTESSSIRGIISLIVLVGGFTLSEERTAVIVATASTVSASLKILLPDDMSPFFESLGNFLTRIKDKVIKLFIKAK